MIISIIFIGFVFVVIKKTTRRETEIILRSKFLIKLKLSLFFGINIKIIKIKIIALTMIFSGKKYEIQTIKILKK